MILSKIRYKGYSWLHNPMTLKIEKEQNLMEQCIPYGEATLQNLGKKSRVIKGTGQLYGDDCLIQYNRLLELQSMEGSGILSLPDIKPFYAFFKSVELACEPTPQLVTYNFIFVEDLSWQNNREREVFYTPVNGETLWDISYKFNVDIDKLVELNPQIKRIDEIDESIEVRIC